MTKRKKEFRKIVLDIIAGREASKYEVYQKDAFFGAVAEVLQRQTGKTPDDHDRYPRDPRLEHDDKLLVQEIFWDLILERVITPGLDFPNSELPYFRLHSESKIPKRE
jgi:hypothetical protein